MSWYTSMKPFRTNLELVMIKYMCSWYDSIPRVEYSLNDQMLIGMSKYVCFYNFIPISFFKLKLYVKY